MQAEGSPSEDVRQRLQSGLFELGLTPRADQVDALLAFQALIERWSRVYNLTAVRDPADMVAQHLLDSASLVPALREELVARQSRQSPGPSRRARILDVGSGAGLPGVVIAILMPDVDVFCIDAVAKKAGFLRQVAAELGLANLQAEHGRVERMTGSARFDLVVSRAFASLADFVALTRQRLAPGGVWIAMKGRRPDEELAALQGVEVLRVSPLQVPGLGAQRCLVWMAPR